VQNTFHVEVKMAPKKNKQKAKAQSGPRLQISAENENRLRRLLLNSARPTPAGVSATATATTTDDTLTKAQKAKKLKAVYDKLSCEGFTNHQIELALSALRVYCFQSILCMELRNFNFLSTFKFLPRFIVIFRKLLRLNQLLIGYA